MRQALSLSYPWPLSFPDRVTLCAPPPSGSCIRITRVWIEDMCHYTQVWLKTLLFFWGGRGVPCKISEHSTWGKPLLYRHWVSCEISVFSFGCLRIMNEGPPRNFLKSDQNSSFRECFCEPLNKVESVLIPWWGGWWMGRLELGWGCWSAGCSCWLEIPHKLFLTKIPLSWNLLKCQNYLIFPG